MTFLILIWHFYDRFMVLTDLWQIYDSFLIYANDSFMTGFWQIYVLYQNMSILFLPKLFYVIYNLDKVVKEHPLLANLWQIGPVVPPGDQFGQFGPGAPLVINLGKFVPGRTGTQGLINPKKLCQRNSCVCDLSRTCLGNMPEVVLT